ncbi:MAG: methanogenesis marker protein Mmp4/MtxX [Methanobrevibacter sp.]|jgi:putative methanogen marker protein 4|nr:methanogenesis marker protein Mmp4/MtxX [Candidatus Methanovirga aequatorialis]
MIKIVAGLGKNKNILKAVEKIGNIKDLEVATAKSGKQLFKFLISDEVDGVVRGSLPSSSIMKTMRRHYNKPINRATYIKEKRNNEHYEFLLAPVGIDEASSLDEKVNLAIQSSKFLKTIDLKPKIAILSSARKDDFGRGDFINKSLQDGEKLYNELKNSSFNGLDDVEVKNYYILLEKAIKEKNNLILCPNGVIGNIIFRSLVLLNSWNSYGAVTLGIDDIFIDTSRDQSVEGYLRSLKLAYQIAKSKKIVNQTKSDRM